MNIACLFGLYPKEIYTTICEDSKTMPQYAADALQWSFVKGLSTHFSVDIFNLIYIGYYPFRYKKMIIKSSIYHDSINDVTLNNVGFNNLVGFNYYSRYINSKKSLKRWIQMDVENRIIIIYAISLPFLRAVYDLKKSISDLKVVLIVPDLVEYMNSDKFRIITNLQKVLLKKSYDSIDAYVLLTEQMKEMLPVGNKPYKVVEGIYNNADELDDFQFTKDDNSFVVFYSGTLAKSYGVLNLVLAIHNSESCNIKLWICGSGDAIETIQSLSLKDERIKYLGVLQRDSVLSIQKSVDLLVNPRSPEGEFTKYSFPSKIMEYFASGTPTLLYPLEGMPEEYFNYCLTINGKSIADMQSRIEEISKMPKTKLAEIGSKAKEFVETRKNPLVQCEKVIELLREIKKNL